MGIWQDLVDAHGFASGYQSVQRFVRGLRRATSPEARVIIETRIGEECQVDYGTGPMARDPETGKYRRTRLFVMTLGYSRKSVRLLTFRSSSRIWAELHEEAFRRLMFLSFSLSEKGSYAAAVGIDSPAGKKFCCRRSTANMLQTIFLM